ncbi:OmpP1/FadL family transporter [Pseudaestuariivita sp.]|uniref:OmpP1/FadL family transporter n=1 Tax=Pseudaestuariivita sp. TaxID=2211669 RepID=UPI004058D6BF
MNKFLTGAAVCALVAGAAQADGISRSDIPLSVMFEEGNYAQLSFGHVTPEVSGSYPAALSFAGGASSTGRMSDNYSNVGAAIKLDMSERLSFGLFFNQPYGANATYSQGFYNGLTADWQSEQFSLVAKYKFNDNFSVYGGVRQVTSDASIAIPDQLIRPGVSNAVDEQFAGLDTAFGSGTGNVAGGEAVAGSLQTALSSLPSPTAAEQAQLAQINQLLALNAAVDTTPAGTFGYTADGEADTQYGYLVGVAYEKPEIALRVALTYESAVTHEFDTVEALPGLGIAGTDVTEVEMPQSVRLDFQSGIAEDTLIFGTVEWTEWSVWEVAPPAYEAAFDQNVTSFDNDVWRYQLGLGRRFTDSFSGFARVTYESAKGGEASRLAPTDGSIAYGIGGTWSNDTMKLTAGLEYVRPGDAEDGSGVEFENNDAIGFGISLGFKF